MPEQTISLLEVLSRLAMSVSFLALIVGAIIFLKLGSGMKAVAILMVFSVVTDMILWNDPSQKIGAWVSRSFTLVEFVLISIFYYAQTDRKIFRRIIVIAVALFPLLAVFDALSEEQRLRDDFVTVCESIILLGYSLVTLYHWMKDIQYESITSAPQFWMVSAILIYFGGNIFVFSSSNYAYSVSREVFDFVWTIHASVALLYYLTLTFGFWKARKVYR